MSVYSFCFFIRPAPYSFFFFFFNDTATTEIYTLSLHDALPISQRIRWCRGYYAGSLSRSQVIAARSYLGRQRSEEPRLNSSHVRISYAVFCLKKKKKQNDRLTNKR